MVEMVKMTEEAFSMEELVSRVKTPASGAVVTFLGTVRADPGITGLDIEDYREMSLKVLRDIRKRAIEEFGAKDVAIVHRVGLLKVGENIVGIAVAAAHREQAFKACRFIIDELKARTPIWKIGPEQV